MQCSCVLQLDNHGHLVLGDKHQSVQDFLIAAQMYTVQTCLLLYSTSSCQRVSFSLMNNEETGLNLPHPHFSLSFPPDRVLEWISF